MMSTRWIMAPAVALIVLMTSWALAAKEEPGVGAADAEASRVVPDGMPELPFRMEWKPIIDGLPQAIYDGLPNKPAAPETGEAALPYGDDGALATPPGPETPTDKSVWESSLAAREQALARTQATLAREMKRSEDILARAEAKLEEARLIRHYAEKACGGSVIGGGPVKGVLPPTPEELEANAKSVAEIVKKMKPSKAAEMLQRWDEPLIIDVLKRLSARATSPILGKMPAEVSGRITSRMLTGEVAIRAGGTE